MSDAAICSGLEWNMKLLEQTSKEILNKFQATFESYWNDKEFYTFDSDKEENVHMIKRASLVVDKINEYVTNLNDVKGLGVCVSVEHGKYMSSFLR